MLRARLLLTLHRKHIVSAQTADEVLQSRLLLISALTPQQACLRSCAAGLRNFLCCSLLQVPLLLALQAAICHRECTKHYHAVEVLAARAPER